MDQLHRHLRILPRVLINHHGEVWVIEILDKLVLRGSVNNPALVVHLYLLLVFLDEVLLLPGQCLCWDGCRSSRVGWADEGSTRDAIVLLGRKGEPEVAVLTFA